MCGISGGFAFTQKGKDLLENLPETVLKLKKRGPDGNGTYQHNNIYLAHTRLSIIDTSEAASQPFTDPSGRFTIVFNGEFFNYRTYRDELIEKGVTLNSNSDTEVLLHLYIQHGSKCLEMINGFFSFAVYDRQKEDLFICRDRYGIKPFLYYKDENLFAFASEMKALMAFGIPAKLDKAALRTYLHLNYVAGPSSIFKNVFKVEPGHFAVVDSSGIKIEKYYSIPVSEKFKGTYLQAKTELADLLEGSVQRRLVSDVPLGTFLSGGIDSSIITLLAARNKENLESFSIGFKDEPYFDETKYARMLARKAGTKHTVFSLGNNDLLENLYNFLDYLDEPFADSSALAVFILSQQTKKHVTVALSGDGADELFGGYNKHQAELRARKGKMLNPILKTISPVLEALPKSRNSMAGNFFRKVYKYSKASGLDAKQRYWLWAGFRDEFSLSEIFPVSHDQMESYIERKNHLLSSLEKFEDMNGVLLNDMSLVLVNDMLRKVDLMSMANGLEVRVPFLDYKFVNFAFSLPADWKVQSGNGKRILKDAFSDVIPEELLNRRKQGFEVPLLKWFRNELKGLIMDDLLEDNFILSQGLFNPEEIKKLKYKLLSSNPDDSVAQVWSLLVFQYWFKKYQPEYS